MAARLDLEVDEGSTWTMTLEFWENSDKNIPVDMTNHEFKGAMQFGTQYIEMQFSQLANSATALIDFVAMEELAAISGKYDIEARDTTNNEKYRVIQGTVRVDREVTIT